MEESSTVDKENEVKFIVENNNNSDLGKVAAEAASDEDFVLEAEKNKKLLNEEKIEDCESKEENLNMTTNYKVLESAVVIPEDQDVSLINGMNENLAEAKLTENTEINHLHDASTSHPRTSDNVFPQEENIVTEREIVPQDENMVTENEIVPQKENIVTEGRCDILEQRDKTETPEEKTQDSIIDSNPDDVAEESTSTVVTEKDESLSDEPPDLDDGLPDNNKPLSSSRTRVDSPFDIVEQEEIESVREDAQRLIEEERKGKEDAERKENEKTEVSEKEESQQKKTASDWLNVLGNDQLKKKVKQTGIGNTLEKGQQVTMKYSMMLASGAEVDKDIIQTFTLGDGEVIAAIDLTCNLAKVGEIFDVVSNSRFAYETFGRPPTVPPDSSVLIEIEILGCEDTPSVEELTEEERVAIGDRKRKIGNSYFERLDYCSASKNYKCAAKYLDPPSYKLEKEDSDDTKELKFKNWCNLALSELKACSIAGGIAAADRALEIFPNSSKAMYRKGKLLFEKGEFDAAQRILNKACNLDPGSVGCKQFLKEISNTITKQKKKQQQMYKKMFNLESSDVTATSTNNNYDSSSWLQGAIPMVAGSIAVGAFAVAGYFGLKALNQ